MAILDDLATLQRQLEELKRKRDKAEGAQQEILRVLKEDYGVSSLEEAKELRKKLKGKLEKKTEEYLKLKKEFDLKWKDKIKEMLDGD